jgi:hypothetical protein
MALSGLFDVVFTQHFFINMTSVFSADILILFPILWVILFSTVCYSADLDRWSYFSLHHGFCLDFKK